MKKNNIIPALVCLFFIVALIIFPERYLPSFSQGLNLFCIAVLPAMFPFFFFTKLLTSLDFTHVMNRVMKKPFKKAYSVPPVAGYIFTLSILSGYPVGAKLVADCYALKLIDTEEATAISSFCSTSGPLFIVGTIGINMFKNKLAGYVILTAHILGALLNGLLYKNKNSPTKALFSPVAASPEGLLEASVTNAVLTVAIVGGYIAIFNLAYDILYDLKILSVLSGALTLIKIPPAIAEGIVCSIIEITRGSKLLSECGYSLKTTVPIVCGMVSLGGGSIAIQSLTFLSSCKIKPSHYLLSKLSQSAISTVLAVILCIPCF